MTQTVVYAKNKSAVIGINTFPNGKIAFNLSVQSLLDPGKVDGACAILTREELIEIRDSITSLLDA